MVKKNFWNKLKKPIMALAPMADVTDFAFREIIAKYGKPDVIWTEFVSADGLVSRGREKLLVDLKYFEKERPIVAQLFGSNPEKMYEAAKIVQGLGFDGLDINMGCPDKAVEKSGAGAALMKNPNLARVIIRAAKEGASLLPISVKTRLGYNKDELEDWLPKLLEEAPSAVIIHARTRKEMSKVPARWERIKRAVEIRDSLKSKTLILGNGDVADIKDAQKKAEETGVDGVMLGRAIFGNPFLFHEIQHPVRKIQHAVFAEVGCGVILGIERDAVERLKIMVEHASLFEKSFRGVKRFEIMRKHLKSYAQGFAGAKELRVKLMGAIDAKQTKEIVFNFLKRR